MVHFLPALFRKFFLPLLFLAAALVFFGRFVDVNSNYVTASRSGIVLSLSHFPNAESSSLIWFALAFATAWTGFLVAIFDSRLKQGLCFLLGIAGVIFLLLAQVNMFAAANTQTYLISFKPSYWIALLCFALAASRAYLLHYKLSRKKPEPNRGVLHINIITYSKKDQH